MHRAAATFALLALLAQATRAAPPGEMTLVLPHPLHAGEIAWLQVRVGTIARGQEIDVTTASGSELGTISPYGVRAEAGTYTLPVPPDAIQNGQLSVKLSITQFGASPRPVTAREVRSVTLSLGRMTR